MDEREIFAHAIEIKDLEQRAYWLDEVAGSQGPLRVRIDQLLHAYQANNDFLEGSPIDELEATRQLNAALGSDFSGAQEHHPESQQVQFPQTVDLPDKQLSGGLEKDALVENRYRLSEELARGGIGSVHLCRDLNLSRNLAAKVLLESNSKSPELTQRIVEEAQIAGQLQHPGIAPIHGLGRLEDDRPFFTMKLVKGDTLSALLRRRDGPDQDHARLINIFGQVCQTIAYAHSHRVIHRDLKPSNIMIGKFGEVQVMDWGLAKVLVSADQRPTPPEKQPTVQKTETLIHTLRSTDSNTSIDDDSHTKTGSVMGTPPYMPPEQALGQVEQIDERADVFGLGAILCEILTGLPPYVADKTSEVFQMAAAGSLDACYRRLESAAVESELISLAMECIQPKLAQRIRNASDVSERLTAFQESYANRLKHAELDRAAEVARTAEAIKTAEAERRTRRFQLGLATVFLGFTLIGIVLIYSFLNVQKEQTETVRKLLEVKSDYLYVSHMQMASQAWRSGAIRRTRELLNHHLPVSGERDRRGPEWYYLDGLTREIEEVPTLKFGGIVATVSVDPQERYVLASGNFGQIKVYDFQRYQLLQTLSGHQQKVVKMLLTPDGNTLISMDWNEMRIWKMGPDGFQSCVVSNGLKPFSTRLSKDGTTMLVPNHLAEVERWDLTKQQPSKVNMKMSSLIADLDVRKDNRHFVVSLENGAIQEWDALENRHLRTLTNLKVPVQTMGVSDSGRFLALANSSTVEVIDLSQPSPTTLELGPTPEGLKSVHALEHSFLIRNAAEAFVWKYTGEFVRQMRIGAGYNISGPLRGGRLAFHSFDHFVSLYSTDTWSVQQLKGHTNTVYNVDIADDGRIVSGGRDETIRIFDPAQRPNRDRTLSGHKNWLWSVDFSPDGDILATGSGDSIVILWDSKTGKEVGRLSGHEHGVRTVAFSPTDSIIATAGGDKDIRLWNLVTRKPIGVCERHSEQVNVVRFSADGKKLVSASDDGNVIIWNVETRQPISIHTTKDFEIWTAIFVNPHEVVFGGTDHQLSRWKFADEESPSSFFESNYNITSSKLSHDGRILACTSADGGITLIEYQTKKVLANPTGHTADAMYTTFSPDDRTLVSAGSDGTVVFWSMDVFEPTLRIDAHDAHVHCVEFSPDGKQIATGSWDHTAKLWRVHPASDRDTK